MLTVDAAKDALKRLGKHPITQQHAFLEMQLPSRDLTNIDVIRQFQFVMNLDLAENHLTSLKALESLPTLVHLDARANRLQECLDFSAPLCDDDVKWKDGKYSAGSLLVYADLSSNEIQSLGDLSRHRFLEQLLLANNRISSIQGLYGLRFLKELDLSHNSISTIEGLDHLPIETLKLRGNKIKFLSGLDNLERLAYLDVALNRIASLEPLHSRKNLNYVDVSANAIEFIRETEYLQNIPWLKTLLMERNPCADKELYRLRVLYRLPTLQRLDNEEASLEDKVRAFNLYHAPQGDLEMRREVLKKYVPSAPFVDYSPQQLPVDEEDEITPRDLQRGVSSRPVARELATKMYEGVFYELG